MTTLSPDAIRRGLRALGVPEARIVAHPAAQGATSQPTPHSSQMRSSGTAPWIGGAGEPSVSQRVSQDAAPSPAVMVLPWSVLVSDNRRASITQGKTKWEAYRDAMAALREAIRDAWSGPKLAGSLVLIARFYEPDRRVRDCGNFRKALLDAMTGIVYRDDSQVGDERYVRAGLSPDRPRVEVEVRAMSSVDSAA